MEELIENLKKEVIELAKNPKFIHHQWFVEFHLNIVEKIALELCDIYSQADKNLVKLLVWFHDYGKVVDFANQHIATIELGKIKLQELGFSPEIIKTVVNFAEIIDEKVNINSAAIEVQIVSSADGASHFIGPFFPIYWYENPNKPIREVIESDLNKAKRDIKLKITLPEARKLVEKYHSFFLEQHGKLPAKFIAKD